jgi:hypothetical protein
MFDILKRLLSGIYFIFLAIVGIPMMIIGAIIVGIKNAIRKSKAGL